jgi:peptide deformylase
MSADQILEHDAGAVTIADEVGVVHVTAEAIEQMEATGQLARVSKMGEGRVAIHPAAVTQPDLKPAFRTMQSKMLAALARGLREEEPQAPSTEPAASLGVLDALDRMASPRQSSAASRANPFHLLYYGDPLLTGEPSVELAADDALPLQVIDAMRRALAQAGGLGISGVHVGAPVRLCIVPIEGARTLLVNPELVKHGRIRDVGQEGSLCVPGFHCGVARWRWVDVLYCDESRARVPHRVRLEGLEARILQHQLDAMNGWIVPEDLTRQQKRQCQRIGDAARRRG